MYVRVPYVFPARASSRAERLSSFARARSSPAHARLSPRARRAMDASSSDGHGAGVFPGNPLSLSLGNADFNRWVKLGKTAREASSTDGARDDGRGDERAGCSRASSRNDARHRFKTPYMTVDDLKKGPKPWREFLCADRARRSYAVPRDWTECKVRLDGNVYEYVGNYVRMGVIFGCVNLYKNPTALVGAMASAKIYRWMDQNIVATSDMQAVKMLGTVVAWFVMMYTKASAALSTTMVMTMVFLGAHGSLRRRDAPKPVKLGKHTGITRWDTISPTKKRRD